MPITNISIAVGGTAEDGLAADMNRFSVRIHPTTEDCWVNFGATAAVNTGILIANGSAEYFNADEYPDIKSRISLRSATGASKISLLAGVR